MKLNHLNLTVPDAGATADFLVRYFGLERLPGGNANFIFLRDDDFSVIALMKGKDATYPQNFHIGFMQANEADVTALNERLKADGYRVDPPARQHAFTFYVRAPGGFLVEVLC